MSMDRPLDSLDVPDGLDNTGIYHLNCYQAAVNVVTSSPSKFTSDMACAVCTGQHPFSACPVLNDFEFLKKHHIQFCLMYNRLRKSLLSKASVYSVGADTAGAPDFHQGEE